jgi:hypothetical protein
MPRKTKKQKIVSDYRKRLRALSPSKTTTYRPSAPISSAIRAVAKLRDVPTEELGTLRKVIQKDVRKTVVFSAIAICIEVMLYFVT